MSFLERYSVTGSICGSFTFQQHVPSMDIVTFQLALCGMVYLILLCKMRNMRERTQQPEFLGASGNLWYGAELEVKACVQKGLILCGVVPVCACTCVVWCGGCVWVHVCVCVCSVLLFGSVCGVVLVCVHVCVCVCWGEWGNSSGSSTVL